MAQQEHDQFFRSRPADKKEERAHQREEQDSGNSCFNCGHHLAPGADICEACGTWLLTDKCCFCYEPFRSGQKFCNNCGNPPEGITCKQCGTHSHFDVCPKCSNALSKRAKPALEKLRNSAEIKELEAMLKPPPPLADPHRHILDQLSNYGRSEEQPTTQEEQPSFRFSRENRDFSGQLSELQQQDKAAIDRKIREMQNKVFDDNQSARMFYESIKVQLAEYKQCPEYLGWRCEYAYAVHYDGPSTCECPTMGGRWICKDEVEMINQWEFILEGEHYKPRPETPRIPRENNPS